MRGEAFKAWSTNQDEGFSFADGEMGALIRAFDWSRTSLGPRSGWPQSLKTTVDLLLRSPVPIVLLWGPDGVMIYNDAYSGFAEGRHPRLLGSKVREGWPEVADFNDNVMRVGLSGGTLSYRDQELTLYRKGIPEQVWMDLNYSPVHDETGAPAGVLAIVVETTGRVMAERALAKSEERLSYALDAAGVVGTFDTDLRTETVYSDARFAAMFSVDPAKGESGAPLAHYLASVHPDDVGWVGEAIGQAVVTGKKCILEYRVLGKDGTVRWLEVHGQCLYEEAGKPWRMPGVAVDITERKNTELAIGRLAAIVASSDDAIIGMDLNGTITTWNRGADQLYDYRSEEAIGTPVAILLPEGRKDEEMQILERISRGEHIRHYETIRQRKDGSLVEVSLTVSPVTDAQGKIIGASKIARDITASKQAERLQRTLMRELKHRMQNTLATVLAIARQSFREPDGGSTAYQGFEARLLALSKGHDLLTRDTWDRAELADVVAQLLAAYDRDRFEIGGPALRLTPKSALALTLALHELATNAAKYGALSVPSGRVSITWEVERADSPHFIFRWQERGGPPVSFPARKGFGSRLIENALANELRGKVRMTYDRPGVICEIVAPLSAEWDDGSQA
ncbi:MAG TPA: PAS domain S-box protein [Hyphomicrobiales bacterium]|nr:PAS domain S-box protein [Hyphomicrobiales bacterium]